jgi:DNA-binding NarL/FixJ family response regulator
LGTIERLNVTEIGARAPSVLVCDLDSAIVDPLELLRQLRFVLPQCIIAVYTGRMTAEWARGCHVSGANCLLSKFATRAELVFGLREALSSGCYTDPRFEVGDRDKEKNRPA